MEKSIQASIFNYRLRPCRSPGSDDDLFRLCPADIKNIGLFQPKWHYFGIIYDIMASLEVHRKVALCLDTSNLKLWN